MEGDARVGILLPAATLRQIAAGKPTWEHAEKYAEAARRLGLEVVLFSLSGYEHDRGSVRGLVLRGGRWGPWKGPVPGVIHNRLVPATLGVAYLVRLLERSRGAALFNPVVPRDRWPVWEWLQSYRALRGRVPTTWPLDREACASLPHLAEERGTLVIRPGYGATNASAFFVEAQGEKKWGFLVRRPGEAGRVVGRDRLVWWLQRLRLRWPYVVQEALALSAYEGETWQLRAAVQRDGAGTWRLIDGVALTSRGALPFRKVLGELFPRPEAVWSEAGRLALQAAESLERRFPNTADLGVDFGVDAQGRPWLVDVTFRDPRSAFFEAGELSTHSKLYENPMTYAHSLLRGA